MQLRDKSEEEIMNDLSPFGFVDFGDDLETVLDPTPKWNHWLGNDTSDENQFL